MGSGFQVLIVLNGIGLLQHQIEVGEASVQYNIRISVGMQKSLASFEKAPSFLLWFQPESAVFITVYTIL